MKEEAGHLANGMPIAVVDDEEKEIRLIVPVGWTVSMLAGNSGCHLEIVRSNAVVGSKAVSIRELKCEQLEPAPTIEGLEKA
jgi:hypothetical protein